MSDKLPISVLVELFKILDRDDCGPRGESWQSDDLIFALRELREYIEYRKENED